MPQTRSHSGDRRTGDIPRAVIAGAALAGLFALASVIGSGLQGPSMREAVLARAAPQQSDDELTTGSIVFVPALGNTCRQNLIDNRTGEIRGNGTVPCNEALAGAPNRRSSGPGANRIDIIRESFRKSSP